MTLEEAIELNTKLAADLTLAQQLTFAEAAKLGIEALKRLKIIRTSWPIYTSDLLPGETKE